MRDTRPPGRELSWQGFVALVVAYLAVLKASGLVIGVEVVGDSPMPDTEVALRNFIVPIGLSAVFGVGVVTWLGWWPQVIRDDHPVRRWVRIVPIFMVVIALLAIDYGNLADQTAGLVLCLIVTAALVGFAEELWFRGIGVHVFRRAGYSEGRVALWTSVIFGAVHVSNAITAGPSALAQALVVSTSGYFLYLCLRVGGVIFLPMFVHGLWDFSLLSFELGPDPAVYAGAILPVLAQVILIVVVLHGRHRTDLPEPAGPAPTVA